MEIKLREYWSKAHTEILESIKEEHTAHETAFSFALGTFIILIPTSAMGLFILGAIAVAFERINRIALFSTAVVFNPVVNMVFYAFSYFIGSAMFGSPSMPSIELFSLTQTFNFGQNLIVGSIVTGLTISFLSYLVVHRVAVMIQSNEKNSVQHFNRGGYL